MRRIDLLLAQARRATENQDFTETAGIQDEELLQYINDGQNEIQTIIFNLFPDVFQTEKTIAAVAQQETYDIPWDAFLGERVEMVEYSRSGALTDFYTLKKGSKRERLNGDSGPPSFYIRRSGSLLLQPKPESAGSIRILYQKQLPRLDLRRAQVLTSTLATDTITSLFFDTSVELDDQTLLEENYISIVDKYGNQEMRNIPIDAINIGTGEVTITPGFVFEDGETISVGSYALRGKNSSTHSLLPETLERYLLEYLSLRILMRDSSVDSAELSALLSKIEETVIRAYSEPDGDVNLIPIIDDQYLSHSEER